MEKKIIASASLIIGIILIILSYRNLYSLNGVAFDSTGLNPLPITPHSSNVTNFIVGIKPDLKKVGVYVDNVAGQEGINHPFEMSLRNGMGAELMATQETPSNEGYYLFDVPNSWNTLGGVRIYNPEDYTVIVNVELIFYTQSLNFFWLQVMILGLLVIPGGIRLSRSKIKKTHTFPLIIKENKEKSEEVLVILNELNQTSRNYERSFDLVFTNKRLILINQKTQFRSYKQVTKIWETIKPTIQKEQEKKYPSNNLTIDELLEKDKSNYAINYSDLEFICLNKALFGRIKLSIKGKKIWKYVNINKEQTKKLTQTLPRINALKQKFENNL